MQGKTVFWEIHIRIERERKEKKKTQRIDKPTTELQYTAQHSTETHTLQHKLQSRGSVDDGRGELGDTIRNSRCC